MDYAKVAPEMAARNAKTDSSRAQTRGVPGLHRHLSACRSLGLSWGGRRYNDVHPEQGDDGRHAPATGRERAQSISLNTISHYEMELMLKEQNQHRRLSMLRKLPATMGAKRTARYCLCINATMGAKHSVTSWLCHNATIGAEHNIGYI